MPVLLSLGVGKAASAHIIASLAKAYGARGWRYVFFRVGETGADGEEGFILRIRLRRTEGSRIRLRPRRRQRYMLNW